MTLAGEKRSSGRVISPGERRLLAYLSDGKRYVQ